MSKSQFIFLELLRAGLWDTEADLSWLRGMGESDVDGMWITQMGNKI